MTGLCPCCGQETGVAHDLLVSLDANAVSRFGEIVSLRPQEAVIVSELWRRHPATLRRTTLLSALYGSGDWPETAESVVKVQIHRIRRALAPLGVEIITIGGRGPGGRSDGECGYTMRLASGPVSASAIHRSRAA